MAADNQDLPLQPDPNIPDQDELGKLPVQPDSPEMPVEEDQSSEGLLDELDNVQKLFDQGESQEDDGESLDAGELPKNEPEPFDSTVVPEIPEPSITDRSTVGFSDEFGGIDLSKEMSSEESPGRIPEVEAVDEASRSFEEMGEDIERFWADGGEDQPDMPGSGASGGQGGDEALGKYMDADFRSRDSMAKAYLDHTARLEELHEQVERWRL